MVDLVARIKQDRFIEPVSTWLECIDPFSPVDCAMSWARESNAWTCAYVYHSRLDNETDLLLSGYAQGAFPIIELQISKASLRLATWLNLLAADTHESETVVEQSGSEKWVAGTSGEL